MKKPLFAGRLDELRKLTNYLLNPSSINQEELEGLGYNSNQLHNLMMREMNIIYVANKTVS